MLGWPDQGLAFDTAIHLGSLLAVAGYFRRDISTLTVAVMRRLVTGETSPDSRFAVCLIIASLPILPVGLFGRFMIETNLRDIEVIIAATVGFGLLLWLADSLRSRGENNEEKVKTELTPGRALLIGLAQCLALIPGTSRSGVTMTAALLLGHGRQQAARISMLISIPTIAGAATVKLWDLTNNPVEPQWFALSLGTILAAASAYACISLFLNLVERIGLLPFVIYRLLLGAVLLAIIW